MLIGTVETRKARKQHACWWCAEPVAIGENYVTWLWKDYGEVQRIKAHPECHEAWGTLPRDDCEVDFGDHCRGCCCQNGNCRCTKF